MLRGKNTTVIAGPYLYMFNRWAVSWLQENGIYLYIPPAEASQDMIEAVFAPSLYGQVLLPLFSYPALFRIRFPLPENYRFLYFSDKQHESFRAFSTPSASFVLPDKPFSIIDRYHTLQKHRFSRFLLDFSHTLIKRSEYRFMLQSLRTGKPLTNTVRFNWKEGFYNPQRVEELKHAHEKQQANRNRVEQKQPHKRKTPHKRGKNAVVR